MPDLKYFKNKEERNKWYRAYRESRREYFRKYNKEYNKQWRLENGYGAEKRWKKRNPEKDRIHRRVERLVKTGRIKKKSCEVCGDKNSVGHHPDYSKPLEVVWLCKIDHYKAHH